MTDTPTTLAALGIEPVAWLHHHPKYKTAAYEKPLPRDADKFGWTETPLYSADDLAPMIAKARRVKALEAALRRLARGKYDMFEVCHLSAREMRDIARAALKENTDG